MKTVVVQLSDIHIDESKGNPILTKADSLASAIYPYLPEADRVVLVVSGDIAYAGTSAQYELAEKFLRDLQAKLANEAACPVEFFIVPGNHDCDFTDEQRSRVANVAFIQAEGAKGIDTSVVETCTAVQRAFFEFRERLHGTSVEDIDALWSELRYFESDKSIVFEGLNVSWVSKKRDEPGKLYFPYDRYERRVREPDDLHLLVMHHPVNWFNQQIYAEFRSFLRERASIVISGHEHVGGASEINDIDLGASIALEGRVLQEHGGNLSNTGFNVVVLDAGVRQYQVVRFDYRAGAYALKAEPQWEGFRPLPKRLSQGLALRQDFVEKLNDPGAYLSGAGRTATLADIYVYPDLVPVETAASDKRVYYNSSKLQTPANTSCGVVISGDERSGRTSFLYQLILHYHAAGMKPLLIDGKEISSAHQRDLDQLIKRTVPRQYEKITADEFGQVSRFEKILFLDNFDDSPIVDAKLRMEILAALKHRFDHLVVTVSPAFEMQEALDGDASAKLQNMRSYRLQPFGNVRRAQLIKRWFAMESDGTVNEAAFIGKCHDAERLLAVVMDNSLIPHAPLYLLTLLQSMQIGRSGELQNSSLGHYYNFLLTQALESAGVKPDKLDIYYQYCSFLAWRFHESGSELLTVHELRKFNDDFNRDWATADFDTFIKTLLAARVIQRIGPDFGFRYPYIYYFLKGRFLSRSLDRPGIAKYIAWCCDHLYVRDNANTVLFLAHHVSNEMVLENIARVLNGLFSDKKPVMFAEDVEAVNKLIHDAPQLVFEENHSPSAHRDRLAEREDEREAANPGRNALRDAPEKGAALSLQARLIMLTKTSEILGQLLKDQHARISRPHKRELIDDIFLGGLRTLRSFYDTLLTNSDTLIEGIKSTLERKGRDAGTASGETLARKFVSITVEAMTLALILIAAKSTTSPDLAEDVASLVGERKALSYRIIELATLLDSAEDLPRRHIESLYEDTENQVIARHIIMYLVLNRLYMFKTTSSDMNWLNSTLKIDIKFQQNLVYGRADAKVV